MISGFLFFLATKGPDAQLPGILNSPAFILLEYRGRKFATRKDMAPLDVLARP